MLKYVLAAAISALLMAAPVATGFAQAPKAEKAEKAEPKGKKKLSKREPSAGQLAARERTKKCGGEWREAKAAGKTKGLTWPKFLSACHKRLKEKAG